MPIAANQLPAHKAWQERVGKEEIAMNKFIQKYSTVSLAQGSARPGELFDFHGDDVAPMHDMHRTWSSPGLQDQAAQGVDDRGRTPLLPQIPTSRGGLGTPSVRSLSQGRLPSRGDLASRRSNVSRMSRMSGLSSDSLRREVADAVQEEVSRVIGPLKERLRSEQSQRQRLEQMLRAAKGED